MQKLMAFFTDSWFENKNYLKYLQIIQKLILNFPEWERTSQTSQTKEFSLKKSCSIVLTLISIIKKKWLMTKNETISHNGFEETFLYLKKNLNLLSMINRMAFWYIGTTFWTWSKSLKGFKSSMEFTTGEWLYLNLDLLIWQM